MRALLSFSFLLSFSSAWALPHGHKVAVGHAEVSLPAPGVLEVRTAKRAEIQWQDFSIGRGETTRFIQPSCDSVVVNRVVGTGLSYIDGLLQANGHVFLINPNGLIIGKEGRINAASFIASTLDVLEQVDALHFFGDSQEAIENLGSIEAFDGDVVLIARKVSNAGEIHGGHVALAAGQELFLQQEKSPFLVRPKDLRHAGGNPYAHAVNHSGLIEARGRSDCSGRILLVAFEGDVQVSGELTSPSGFVSVQGGESAHVEIAGSICTDALERGSGGHVEILSEGASHMCGKISARGGRSGGDGGFVEISGRRLVEASGVIDRSAVNGKGGALLIDPIDITISSGVDSNHTGATPVTPTATPSVLNIATLVGFLASGPVVVQSSGAAGAETGGITLASPLIYSSANDLTLKTTVAGVTAGDIQMNAALTQSGNGRVLLDSVDDVFINAPITLLGSGALQVTAKQISVLSSVLASGTGGMSLTAQSAVNVGSLLASSASKLEALSSPITVSASSGSINVLGGNVVGASSQILGGSSPVTLSATGSLVVRAGLADAAFAKISSTSGNIVASTSANISLIAGSSSSSIQNTTGSLSLSAGGSLTLTGASSTASIANTSGGISLTAASLNLNAASISNDSSTIGINTVSLNLNAANAPSYIRSSSGPLSIAASGDVNVNGGSSSGSFAEISSVSGDVTFTSIGGSLALSGGSGANAYAQIGVGNLSAVTSINSAVRINSLAGSLSLLGGSEAGAYAQIGHAPTAALSAVSVSGDIQLPVAGIAGDLLLQGGSAPNTSALIGHGNELTPYLGNASGSMQLRASGSSGMRFLGGGGSGSHAGVGFFNPSTGSLASFSPLSSLLSLVTTNGNITLTRGVGASQIGSTAGSIGTLTLTSSRDLVMTGGSVSGRGAVSCTAQNVNLSSSSSLRNGGSGSLITTAVGNLSMSGSSAQSLAGGALRLISGSHMSLTSGSTATTNGAELHLIVDNAYPAFPGIGVSTFVLDGSSSLSSSGGPLKIFTARSSLNTISGTLNGQQVFSGWGADSSTERYLTYFNSSEGGFPYTIFYKNAPTGQIVILQTYSGWAHEDEEGYYDEPSHYVLLNDYLGVFVPNKWMRAVNEGFWQWRYLDELHILSDDLCFGEEGFEALQPYHVDSHLRPFDFSSQN